MSGASRASSFSGLSVFLFDSSLLLLWLLFLRWLRRYFFFFHQFGFFFLSLVFGRPALELFIIGSCLDFVVDVLQHPINVVFVWQILVLIVLRCEVYARIWLMQKDLHIEAFQINMLADSVLSRLLASSLPRFHILLSVSIIALIPTAMDQFIFFELTISSPGLSERLLVILIPFELDSIFLFSPRLLRYFLFSPFFLVFAIFSFIFRFRANFVQVLIFN